ncbi:MAG TPA: ABC transporter ATP-binding protein [Mycobacteriales bacterium]|nr:ABC transporter ATP-binding protein [Mycobacteriales bacterium]
MSVRLEGVRKRFGRAEPWVLDGIDATFAAGAVTLVVGGNGSGKSTLLRTVVGASAPTRGRVLRPAGPAAYVPERLPAELRMTARQYVRHMGRLRGLPAPAVTARAEELFERLGLRPGPDVPVGELSKGNSQKVALTQALLAPTALLVLDEPYTGLDPAAAAALTGLVLGAREHGAAVLLSGHETAVSPEADATYAVRGGVLAAVDAPAAVRTRLVLRRGRADAAPPPGGVWDAGRGLLVVVTADPDETLRTALATGWSFVEGVRS